MAREFDNNLSFEDKLAVEVSKLLNKNFIDDEYDLNENAGVQFEKYITELLDSKSFKSKVKQITSSSTYNSEAFLEGLSKY